MDKLIDDIIELILGDVCCHHEVSRDEDSYYASAEYSLDSERKIREKIGGLIEQFEETASKETASKQRDEYNGKRE